MKILSLYIDKWYIVGAVMDGANKYPLTLSNAEERIWLYFYSNNTTNAVKYSLSYRDEALEGKNGYYADIFDILPDYKEYHYEKYGAEKGMKDIFADAGILNDLRNSFDDKTEIPVYLSFSKDIDVVSQDIFVQALENEHFKVLEFTLPIEQLALDYTRKRKGSITNGYMLVVNACNENLLYSIYHQDGEKSELIIQKCEPGYGVDSRKKAIVEEVLEYLQDDTHFLTGDINERQDEMLYLSQFANSWLSKLDESPSHIPVALGNIHFKKQSNNDIPVVVFNDNINDRTKNIIEKLTGKIADTIKEKGILFTDISQIIMLGDVFSNKTFVNLLQKKLGTSDDCIIAFSERSLPDVVSIYSTMDGIDFDKEKADRVQKAHAKYIHDRQKSIEQKTRDLKEKAATAENEGRLQDAIAYYERILRIDSKDKYSSVRISSIKLQIDEEKNNIEKVNELLDKARQDFISNKYTDAVSKCDKILCLQKNNIDAEQIKEKSEKAIIRQNQLEIYIQNINDKIAEGGFYDAQNILQKIDSMNFNDSRLKDIRETIEKGVSVLDKQKIEKSLAFDAAFRSSDYQLCLKLCNELLQLDSDKTLWYAKKDDVQRRLQDEQRYKDNYNLAQKARIDRNWAEVIEFAQKAIAINSNDELLEWISEAQKAIKNAEMSRIQEEFVMAYANSQWNDVIKLYDQYRELRQKSSNSIIYRNAKRFRRNGGNTKVSDFSVSDGNKQYQEETTPFNAETPIQPITPPKKDKPRSGPIRPTSVPRPKMNMHISEKYIEKKTISPVRPKVGRPNRTSDNECSAKDITKETPKSNSINNKHIFNKPKR